MLHGRCKHIIMMSRCPLMLNALERKAQKYFPEISVDTYSGMSALFSRLKEPNRLIIIELSGDPATIQTDIRTLLTEGAAGRVPLIILVPDTALSEIATLFSSKRVQVYSRCVALEDYIHAINIGLEQVTTADNDIAPAAPSLYQQAMPGLQLTLSERQVLRLLAKGWSINQISQLLKKSNKTVSAQKNSAMRRLSLRSNAEMYAWINSLHGMWELNIQPSHREAWKWN